MANYARCRSLVSTWSLLSLPGLSVSPRPNFRGVVPPCLVGNEWFGSSPGDGGKAELELWTEFGRFLSKSLARGLVLVTSSGTVRGCGGALLVLGTGLSDALSSCKHLFYANLRLACPLQSGWGPVAPVRCYMGVCPT